LLKVFLGEFEVNFDQLERFPHKAKTPSLKKRPRVDVNPVSAIGIDEAAQEHDAARDARNPRCSRECIERLSKTPDVREVAPGR
jgi:hypothetical protein